MQMIWQIARGVPLLGLVGLVAVMLASAGCGSGGAGPVDATVDRPDPDTYIYRRDGRSPRPDLGLADAPAPRPADGAIYDWRSSAALLVAPFFLDFEQDDGGLEASGDWEWGHINFSAGPGCSSTVSPPTAGRSGTGMWGTVLNDCYNPRDNASVSCANVAPQDDSILSLRVRIPATHRKPRLTYWEWADYLPHYDWSEIRIDGAVVSQSCKGAVRPPAAWVERSIALDQYVGRTVTIAFHFMSTKVVNDGGWYLDDVSVAGD